MQVSTTIRLASAWLCLAMAGCQRASTPPTKGPASASQPAITSTQPAGRPAKVRKPQRPKPSWGIFQEAFDEDADASMTCNWTGGKRLEVISNNVRRFTLDLTRLPPDAPQTGPWILQVDKQGIQITGLRGKVLDLVRSPNGVWSVDKDGPSKRESGLEKPASSSQDGSTAGAPTTARDESSREN